ncbi:fructokinase [Streptomyces sp. DvalAA-14]|uniref:carbohydrate kinase family protein n=1 Tax=unclassified Streptomyces TaxID=2593676 RepID=UPI00081B2AAC|nr:MULTISPECIES: carbohydrate kinase [unclassified Streptomyces]MYS22899.1 carbohydrate kinase [Streptomyces sp. SID4948]SCE24203.1 fructokinase [Streptomyces sp. DvalAA-14]
MGDFLVVGECVADIVRADGREDVPHPGGSPANVAYGLARLGRGTVLLTQLGGDPAGALIGAHLRSAGVELLGDLGADAVTPTAVVTLDGQGQASYAFDVRWTLRTAGPLPGGIRHVHLGSIGAVTEPGAATVREVVARLRTTATVSYDPNVRPALLGSHGEAVARVEACVALSDLVKASDEDLAWLCPGEPPREVAERWLTLGPAAVVVTFGGAGSTAYTAAGELHGAPVRAEVADTVGAGDSFMAAALDALAGLDLLGAAARPRLAALDQASLAAVLHRAATAAALTVSRPGANPPDLAELRAALRRAGRQPCPAPAESSENSSHW